MEEVMFGKYKRDEEGRNCLYLSKTKETYEGKMLEEAKPSGFLQLLKGEPGEYGYDITGKKTLSVAFERVPMNAEQIKKVIGGILQTAVRAEEYLLRPECLVLTPEHIYLNFPEYEISLCYYPEYQVPFFRQLGKLFEIFLNRVDYREEQAISLVYGLYMLLQEPDVTIGKIRERIMEEEGSEVIFSGKESGTTKYHEQKSVPEKPERRFFYGEKISGEFRQYNPEGNRLTEPLGERNRREKSSLSENRKSNFFEKKGYEQREKRKTELRMAEIGKAETGKAESRKTEGWRTETGKSENKDKKKSWLGTFFHKEPLPDYGFQPAMVEEAPPEWGGHQTRVLSVSGVREEPSFVSERNGEVFFLTKFPFFVGSLSGYSDLLIERDTVSRFHAKLEKNEDGIVLIDLNSTNGTKINGAEIPMQQGIKLKSGDRVTFADESYRFYHTDGIR